MTELYKQVIVVRLDLNMSNGKLAAQVAHAATSAALSAHEYDIARWRGNGMAKIVLSVPDIFGLALVQSNATRYDLNMAAIRDAGRTELAPETWTVIAVGPNQASLIDRVTGSLPLLRG